MTEPRQRRGDTLTGFGGERRARAKASGLSCPEAIRQENGSSWSATTTGMGSVVVISPAIIGISAPRVWYNHSSAQHCGWSQDLR
jgi:hypothetical protein